MFCCNSWPKRLWLCNSAHVEVFDHGYGFADCNKMNGQAALFPTTKMHGYYNAKLQKSIIKVVHTAYIFMSKSLEVIWWKFYEWSTKVVWLITPVKGSMYKLNNRTQNRALRNTTRMNEWMMHLVYCCTPKALYNHVGRGVSPQPPPVCSIHLDDATAATGQRHQCAHHTPATGGEERES